MKILVLDLETTVQRIDKRIDNSPKNPSNRCVSAHYGWLGDTTVDEVHSDIWFHKELISPSGIDRLKDHLADADMMICHNVKFDAEWLMEMGFELPPLVRDTMITEYLLAKGQRRKISLKDSAIRRKIASLKKSDLIDEMFKEGTGFEEMPLKTVLEYAEADVRACGELYLAQQEILQREHNQSLQKVIPFMHEMLLFLCEIEMNGVKIDMDALLEVEKDFEIEKAELNRRLLEISEQVMGDIPINLNSNEDMAKVIYSREVIDKSIHQQTFNIGTNAAGKSLLPPRMNKNQFVNAVRTCTKVVLKQRASVCPDCEGVGSIQKYKTVTRIKNKKKFKIQGEPYKNRSKCKTCNGSGAIYTSTGVTAGLKMAPSSPNDASINGFKTDKETISRLILQAKRNNKDLAVEFLTKISRLSAVNIYLDSFVAGIKRGTRKSGFLHANFHQCRVNTGRLSSGGGMSLNLQNQPKRGFPVRKCFVSRFTDGILIESDYSGLEFRTACELSRDAQGIADILEGKDIHRQTASIINQCDEEAVTKSMRQKAKAFSFLPLFGGTSFGHPPHIAKYLDGFYDIYKGIYGWHQSLMTGTLRNGTVETPSGRQYFWPDVQRTRNNRVSNSTQILNYPVQGFSADIVQLACIRAHKLFKAAKLKSKLILTVHDSLVVDTHPLEIEKVKTALRSAMTLVGEETKKRFDYELVVPLEIEITGGINWLEQNEYA